MGTPWLESEGGIVFCWNFWSSILIMCRLWDIHRIKALSRTLRRPCFGCGAFWIHVMHGLSRSELQRRRKSRRLIFITFEEIYQIWEEIRDEEWAEASSRIRNLVRWIVDSVWLKNRNLNKRVALTCLRCAGIVNVPVAGVHGCITGKKKPFILYCQSRDGSWYQEGSRNNIKTQWSVILTHTRWIMFRPLLVKQWRDLGPASKRESIHYLGCQLG